MADTPDTHNTPSGEVNAKGRVSHRIRCGPSRPTHTCGAFALPPFRGACAREDDVDQRAGVWCRRELRLMRANCPAPVCREAIARGAQFYSLEFFPPHTVDGARNLVARMDRLARMNPKPLFIDITWTLDAGKRYEIPTSVFVCVCVRCTHIQSNTHMMHMSWILLPNPSRAGARASDSRSYALYIRYVPANMYVCVCV